MSIFAVFTSVFTQFSLTF